MLLDANISTAPPEVDMARSPYLEYALFPREGSGFGMGCLAASHALVLYAPHMLTRESRGHPPGRWKGSLIVA